MEVDIAYWDGETDTSKKIGKADSPNKVGEIILREYPDVSAALTKGVFYFRTDKRITYSTQHTSLSLWQLIEHIFAS